MDNSNNPNNPFSPQNTVPASGSTPPPPASTPQAANPWQPQNTPSSPWGVPNPTPAAPAAQPSPLSSQQPDLSTTPQMYPQNPVFPTEPTPTFTPPPAGGEQSNLSPLDNPLGAPMQPPPIDDPGQANPPIWSPPPQPAQEPIQSVPTDLSHLISNNDSPQQPQPGAETLIVPNTASPEVPNLPTEGRKSIPKWLIGIGIGLLLLVTGASAYFILGIGKTPETSSVPATTQTETSQIKPPPPVATPVTQPTPQPTGSANFGELGGAQQATSAADLLRQRQQQNR